LSRAKRPEVSLQTRRKLTYDFIEHNFFAITLFTIATVCVKHPIFLQFLMPPENAGSVSQVTDYFSQVDLAGPCAFNSKGRSFFDFCCFLDHISSWNAQSRPIASTESLHGELFMFVSKKRNKLSESQDEVNELGANARFIFSNATSSSSHDLSPQTKLHDPRPVSSVLSDQSGEKKETVCLPSGKVLLGRDQKPIGRSELSFADCGVLVGPGSMMIFDEDGHPFTKRKLCMAADSKPALDEHHRLQKVEHEKVVQREFSEKKVVNELSCSQKFCPVSSQERPKASSDGSGHLFSARDGLPVIKGEVDTDEHHRLTRKLEYEPVWRETAGEIVNDLLACYDELCGQGRPSKISPDRAFFDASGGFVSGRNGFPVNALISGPSVDSVLALLDGPDWVAMTKTLQNNE